MCFNPLQVFYKLFHHLHEDRNLACFNPLQVFYKHAISRFKRSSMVCFNPLQVFYKRSPFGVDGYPKGKFQSLIGILQTNFSSPKVQTPKLVSIPYRYSTNSFRPCGNNRRCIVSIPYRYSTNFLLIFVFCTIEYQFQSLIGILQTFLSSHSPFPFYRFQSLIGILQTLYSPIPLYDYRIVSIPYRYSTNYSVFNGEETYSLVSIPYRYSTNVIIGCASAYSPWFQSLIGILQTRSINVWSTHLSLFQSLIGILQTTVFGYIIAPHHAFQSLIGILQTSKRGRPA